MLATSMAVQPARAASSASRGVAAVAGTSASSASMTIENPLPAVASVRRPAEGSTNVASTLNATPRL